jgi:hypothetical protein
VSETTLSAEVEAALLLRTTKALLTCGRNPNCDCSPCVVEAQEATLRTALERAGHIEAALKSFVDVWDWLKRNEPKRQGRGDFAIAYTEACAALDRENG